MIDSKLMVKPGLEVGLLSFSFVLSAMSPHSLKSPYSRNQGCPFLFLTVKILPIFQDNYPEIIFIASRF